MSILYKAEEENHKHATDLFIPTAKIGSPDSSVVIATGYGLDDGGFGVRVPLGSRIPLLHVVQTGSEAHLASYPMGTRGSPPGVKQPGREADHSPPTSAEVK
jgi:hypothetical protein